MNQKYHLPLNDMMTLKLLVTKGITTRSSMMNVNMHTTSRHRVSSDKA